MRRVLSMLSLIFMGMVTLAQPSYEIQPLGDQPFIPTHFAADGRITGYLSGSLITAAYWQNGQLTALTVPSSTGSRLFSADSTILVGSADFTFPDQTRAISWQNGQSWQLPVPDWPSYNGSQAVAVSSDRIVGTVWRIDYDFYGQLRRLGKGIVWRNSDFQLTPFYQELDNSLVDVNVGNWMLGWVESRITGYVDSFLWHDQTVTMLGLPSHFGYATALNDINVVVGSYDWGQIYGFVWSNGQMDSLPLPLGAVACRPRDITNTNLVVGEMEYAGGLTKPFWFWGDQLTFLQDILPSGSDWQLATAVAANDTNQVIGYGYYHGQPRGYLLTPVSEPPTIVVLFLLVALYWRRKLRPRQ